MLPIERKPSNIAEMIPLTQDCLEQDYADSFQTEDKCQSLRCDADVSSFSVNFSCDLACSFILVCFKNVMEWSLFMEVVSLRLIMYKKPPVVSGCFIYKAALS